MTNEDPIPYDLIGRLTVRFGLVDFIAHSIAWELLEDPARGAAVTEGLSVDRVAELIARLAGAVEPTDLRDELTRASRRISDLVKMRNAVTHSLWLDIDGEASARRIWPLLRQLATNELRPPEPGIPSVMAALREADALTDSLIAVISRLQARHSASD